MAKYDTSALILPLKPASRCVNVLVGVDNVLI